MKPKTTQEKQIDYSEDDRLTKMNPLPDDTIVVDAHDKPRPEGQTQPSREDDEEEVKKPGSIVDQIRTINPNGDIHLTLHINEAFLIFK